MRLLPKVAKKTTPAAAGVPVGAPAAAPDLSAWDPWEPVGTSGPVGDNAAAPDHGAAPTTKTKPSAPTVERPTRSVPVQAPSHLTHDSGNLQAALALQFAESQRAARRTVAEIAGVPEWPSSPDERRRALKRARRSAHPDANGGDRALWDRLEEALIAAGMRDWGA